MIILIPPFQLEFYQSCAYYVLKLSKELEKVEGNPLETVRHSGVTTLSGKGWTGKDGSPSPTLGTIIKILW